MIGIKFARQRKGLSQQQLADMLEVNMQTISKWERGLISIKPKNLLKLSEILEVTCDYLLKGEN